ncbi:MAG TPA: hypothetical protein VNV36_13355 [Pseudomonas sp.]|nr:hypothetical protein [Pseudomonas sp.]HWH87746.1 hypothetical protein [Pseudomonas sp.]
MKKLYVCLGFCSVFLLHGCFDSNNASDKDEDTSKASVQLQQKKSE